MRRYQPMTASPKSNAISAAGARKMLNGSSRLRHPPDDWSASSVWPLSSANPRAESGYTTPSNTMGARKAAIKTVNKARGGPSAAPTTAINVTSPNPIAGLLSQTSPSHPAIDIAPAPTHMPSSASHGPANRSASAENTAKDARSTTHNRPDTAQ